VAACAKLTGSIGSVRVNHRHDFKGVSTRPPVRRGEIPEISTSDKLFGRAPDPS
jgi:hypothetical protein